MQIASFLAVLPDIQGAIKVAGQGSARITFETCEEELPEVIRLVLGKDRLLRVTVEIAEESDAKE